MPRAKANPIPEVESESKSELTLKIFTYCIREGHQHVPQFQEIQVHSIESDYAIYERTPQWFDIYHSNGNRALYGLESLSAAEEARQQILAGADIGRLQDEIDLQYRLEDGSPFHNSGCVKPRYHAAFRKVEAPS
jgi:hypothetical protein